MNLKAVAIGTGPGGWSPEAAYRSRTFIETYMRSSREWKEHLDLHRSLRDLLRVAAWRPINFQSHRAASSAEDVEIRGNLRTRWCEVRTATTGIAAGVWESRDRFLFYFSDIGTRGISRWLELAERYERGIILFVSLLDLEGVTVDAVISQLGIALEAVGYQALIESGLSPSSANGKRVSDRIDHLVLEVAESLSFAHATFGQEFAGSYNSVKHANRLPVEPDVKLEHVRHGVELLRVWIALRLGLTPATLVARR